MILAIITFRRKIAIPTHPVGARHKNDRSVGNPLESSECPEVSPPVAYARGSVMSDRSIFNDAAIVLGKQREFAPIEFLL